MIVNINIDGEEYSICGRYEPAEGDGWNEPYYPECFDIYEVRNTYGNELPNWQDYWTPAYVENTVLMELKFQKWQTESDDPYKE